MKDFILEDCRTKLQALPHEAQVKMIWMWIKQDHINIKQFEELLYFFKEA